MQTIRYETNNEGIVTLTFDEPNSAVNTMSLEWQRDLHAAVDQLAAEKEPFTGVILASAKSTFFAGANLKLVLQLTEADAPRCYDSPFCSKPVLACCSYPA